MLLRLILPGISDIYDIGMSNLVGYLYELINQRNDALAERSYNPWIDMEAAMRSTGILFIHWKQCTLVSL